MYPLSLPTKTRPAATVGCEEEVSPVGNPKAHFNFKFGTWGGGRARARAGLDRGVGVIDPPVVPCGCWGGAGDFRLGAALFGHVAAAPAGRISNGPAAMNSATRRFWPSLSASA